MRFTDDQAEQAMLGTLRNLILSSAQQCDLELLLSGGFQPLNGFLKERDYLSVVHSMRLSSGVLWPIPVTLSVTEEFAASLSEGEKIALCNEEGLPFATMNVESLYRPDLRLEAQNIFGTTHDSHPGVASLLRRGKINLGGTLQKLTRIPHYDFVAYRHTPSELKAEFLCRGWTRVVAFQTRNPMHNAHIELTLRAMRQVDACLLLHPVVGSTKAGDIAYPTRVRCYLDILNRYPEGKAMLSLLPLAMRMAGPREAVWHAIIRRNFGATHFIVGRDHAGPGKDANGRDFYDPYAAQQLALEHAAEIGIEVLAFEELVYLAKDQRFVFLSEVNANQKVEKLSGSELRQRIENGKDIPSWFSPPSVITRLRKTRPPKREQGFVLFFTGLSGAGKSTLANALAAYLQEGSRAVSLLDGDVVRRHLCSDLGFSKADRDANIKRIGYIAAEIARAGGIVLCALIAPYAQSRVAARAFSKNYEVDFIEIYVATDLSTCEKRDRKGLYAKARKGTLNGMTGIDAPYEIPSDPDLTIDCARSSVEEAVEIILCRLRVLGLVLE